ncbi:hypothetical protein Pcinc_040354 [Petrolisthes cinctipes]|uniref:Uncharacterized protein n=1 Tax=Petrolisthes cinctipes TaxID=88211 RepID=A0AAE1BLR9_PETCI|nr:hypothetical protein Pcinc_040354 [Petrolisthes cinctipes]
MAAVKVGRLTDIHYLHPCSCVLSLICNLIPSLSLPGVTKVLYTRISLPLPSVELLHLKSATTQPIHCTCSMPVHYNLLTLFNLTA